MGIKGTGDTGDLCPSHQASFFCLSVTYMVLPSCTSFIIWISYNPVFDQYLHLSAHPLSLSTPEVLQTHLDVQFINVVTFSLYLISIMTSLSFLNSRISHYNHYLRTSLTHFYCFVPASVQLHMIGIKYLLGLIWSHFKFTTINLQGIPEAAKQTLGMDDLSPFTISFLSLFLIYWF